MSHPPEAAPSYEGRRLPRPAAELVDQGLAFDLGTLASRRQLLRGVGLGVAALGLAACAERSVTSGSPATAAALQEIADETAGPFPGYGSDGLDVLGQSGVIRSDLRSSFGGATGTAEGVPMTLELRVQDLARDGAGFGGVAVYVWHCDREGRYSMYSEDVTDQNYLRGVQVAGEDGLVRFSSIFPGCYPGRWPHVHFEVYPDRSSIADPAKAIATSQVALPADASRDVYAQPGYEGSARALSRVSLTRDGVFADDAGRTQLAEATGDVRSGYRVSLPVGIDIRTAPSAGR